MSTAARRVRTASLRPPHTQKQELPLGVLGTGRILTDGYEQQPIVVCNVLMVG